MEFDLGLNGDSHIFQLFGELGKNLFHSMSSFFSQRSYTPGVNHIVVKLYWESTVYIRIYRRPRYIEDKYVKVFPQYKEKEPTHHMFHVLFVEIRLPDSFVGCNEQEAIKMIADTMISYFTETPLPLKIRKSFDKERFIADLRTFFDSYKGIDIGSDQGTK